MTFEEYQEAARSTAIYPAKYARIYPTLGLAGEAGEVAEKVKKIIRDKGGIYTDDDQLAITKELGDVLWYVSQVASDFGIVLEDVASTNVAKLADRALRNALQGSGDER